MKRIEVKPGDEYGRLVVVREVEPHRQPSGKIVRRFLCECKCGNMTTVMFTHLSTKRAKSCGCLRRDACKQVGSMITHGMTGTPTFKTWDTMKQRCNNPNDDQYPNYGGRGIKVCERWSSFENFLADMGERPDGLSIDRIDNNGNYEPGNCRAEWAIRVGLTYRTVCARYKSGWTVDKLLTTKSRRSKQS